MSNNIKNEIFEGIYEENKKVHIEYLKSKMPKKDIEELNKIYDETITKYVNHINSLLNVDYIKSASEENVELKNLIPAHLCDNIFLKKLIDNKLFNGIVYVDILNTPAYLNVKNMIVEQGHNLQTIPGLINGLKTEEFNTFFNGRNIIEVKYLLEQMQLISKNCELEKSVNEYFENKNLRSSLIENIMCMIIINDFDEYTKDRIKIIRMASGINIDVSKYMNTSSVKKLTFTKENK